MELTCEEGCEAFVGTFAEIPQIVVQGADPNETVEILREAFEIWVENMEADSLPVPQPWGIDTYSGRLLVRMPTGLHGRLAREAERQGSSLNQLIATMLATSLGYAEGRRSVAAEAPVACEDGPPRRA